MTIRGRHPRYADDVPEEHQRQHQRFLEMRERARLRPNFEGIAMDEDPDAYDRERDRRLEDR